MKMKIRERQERKGKKRRMKISETKNGEKQEENR